jgi:integrase
MPRPRQDGQPPRAPNRRKLTEIFLKKLKPDGSRTTLVWDTDPKNLAIQVQPKPTGTKSWKVIYSHHNRVRWYHIGGADAIGLADARLMAKEVMLRVAKGEDPQAERKAQRMANTFEELATRYLEEHAKKTNKSWRQADALVKKHLLPRWAKLKVGSISRSDVDAMMSSIKAPIVANQTLAAASAMFSWAIKKGILKDKANPCALVDRNEVKERERILSNTELPLFWSAFSKAGTEGEALKMILLTGQRPGEVIHMRREHIIDGWWEMPGKPLPALGWPGTKNAASHRVWLPKPAQTLLEQLSSDGFVLSRGRGRPMGPLHGVMRDICTDLGIIDRVTPHDLRRTHGTMITRLAFGRDAMNRIQNHREGGIASVYDRHQYADENKHIMESVAAHILGLAEGNTAADNVVPFAAA